MINIPAGARVLLATRPVDFRKGAHSLAALAQEVLAEDPFAGAVIVYRAKQRILGQHLLRQGGGRMCTFPKINGPRRQRHGEAGILIMIGRPRPAPRATPQSIGQHHPC